jgi:hypothetical protein
MLISTNAPIIEEQSNAIGKRKKGTFGKRASEKIRSGIGKFTQAGGLGVIENLINPQGSQGNSTGETNFTPPPPPPTTAPTGMTTTTKVIIGVLVVGAIAGAYFYFNKSKSKGKKSSK